MKNFLIVEIRLILMSDSLIIELDDFLKSANLSSYEINTYITLLKYDTLTAREISIKSNVPIGRIYDILQELKLKGMIEVQNSRPKYYKSLPFNFAFQNLIAHIVHVNQRRISLLYEKARNLESKIYNSDIFFKPTSSTTFWSTEFNINSMISLFVKESRDLKEELLATSILNDNIIDLVSYGRKYFQELHKASRRGVKIKYLWSPEPEKGKPLTLSQINKNQAIFKKMEMRLKDLYNLSNELEGFKLRFIPKRIPTNFNIFDSSRVIIKMQNPFNTSEILSVMSVLDPNLAQELRKLFFNLWDYESIII
jgi:sugar-specific transcriptional regulator TrmB